MQVAPPRLRIAVRALAPGTMLAERDIRGVVAGVFREPGIDVLCEVKLSTGRVLLLHPFRRVGVE